MYFRKKQRKNPAILFHAIWRRRLDALRCSPYTIARMVTSVTQPQHRSPLAPLPNDDALSYGEKHACHIRLFLLLFIAVWLWMFTRMPSDAPWPSPHWPWSLWAGWALLRNAALLLCIHRRCLKNEMATASIAIDALHAAALTYALSHLFPPLILHATFIPALLAISLSALRRSAWRVIFAGALNITLWIVLHREAPIGQMIAFGLLGIATTALLHRLIIHFDTVVAQQQALFDHIPDGVVTVDAANNILSVNRTFRHMTGQPHSNLRGTPLAAFLPDSHSSTHLIINEIDTIPVAVTAADLTLGAPAQRIISIRDYSDQQHLRHQLERTQKVDTLGHLAGGLAHDFNNFLGGIVGASSAIQKQTAQLPHDTAEKIERYMAIVDECTDNARSVIQKLLAFSRASQSNFTVFNLWHFMADIEHICTKTFRANYRIHLAREVADQNALFNGDENALSQALLHLCINARDAMPGGGTLFLSLSEYLPTPPFILRHPDCFAQQTYWRIEVFDNGPGMPTDILEQAQDPFFTTKEPRPRCSGLGLSIAQNIVGQHNGIFEVDSIENEGTRVRIFLPRNTPTPPSPEP